MAVRSGRVPLEIAFRRVPRVPLLLKLLPMHLMSSRVGWQPRASGEYDEM